MLTRLWRYIFVFTFPPDSLSPPIYLSLFVCWYVFFTGALVYGEQNHGIFYSLWFSVITWKIYLTDRNHKISDTEVTVPFHGGGGYCLNII